MARILLKERTDGGRGLTTSQIRTTVDKLHELKFFARCHLGKKTRQTYYSHRMSNDELREAVIKRKLYRREFKAEEARKNAEAAERYRARSDALDGVQSNQSADAPASSAQLGASTATPVIPPPGTSTPSLISTPPPMGPRPRLSEQVAEAIRSSEQEPRAASETAAAQEMEPSTVDAVRDHFNGLRADTGRHAEAYVKSRNWESHKEGWRKSSARWLFDILRKERAAALAT
jgi:hypothetical protein